MINNFPLLSQNDKRWKTIKLGTSDVTIGGYGCLITCISMLCTYYGIPTTPDKLNAWCTTKVGNQLQGYASQNLYLWDSILKFTNLQIGHVGQSTVFDGKEPCVIQVDFYPATDYPDMHWVVYLGSDMCADPWDGTIKNISAYGGRSKVKSVHLFKNNSNQPTTGGSMPSDRDYRNEYYTTLGVNGIKAVADLIGVAVPPNWGDDFTQLRDLAKRTSDGVKIYKDNSAKLTSQVLELTQKNNGLSASLVDYRNDLDKAKNDLLGAQNDLERTKLALDKQVEAVNQLEQDLDIRDKTITDLTAQLQAYKDKETQVPEGIIERAIRYIVSIIKKENGR